MNLRHKLFCDCPANLLNCLLELLNGALWSCAAQGLLDHTKLLNSLNVSLHLCHFLFLQQLLEDRGTESLITCGAVGREIIAYLVTEPTIIKVYEASLRLLGTDKEYRHCVLTRRWFRFNRSRKLSFTIQLSSICCSSADQPQLQSETLKLGQWNWRSASFVFQLTGASWPWKYIHPYNLWSPRMVFGLGIKNMQVHNRARKCCQTLKNIIKLLISIHWFAWWT